MTDILVILGIAGLVALVICFILLLYYIEVLHITVTRLTEENKVLEELLKQYIIKG